MSGAKPQALINLLRGWPNPSLLPVQKVQLAAQSALSDPSIAEAALSYAPDPGYQPLREHIARWLTGFYAAQAPISPERVCISGGASQNLACILQVFSDPIYTRNVWMVSPTYFLACRIFEDNGFCGKLRSVPEDAEGIDMQFLERGLRESDEAASARESSRPSHLKPQRPWNKFYRHLVYAVPTFSNPSSKTMSLVRRQQLVRLARVHDALVITDDVYDQLQWPASPIASEAPMTTAVLPRVVDVDEILDGGTERPQADGFGNAVSNGSFSKIVGPGCRTGWAEGTEKFAWGLSQVGSSRSGGAPSQLVACSISQLLESGALQSHISNLLQPTYARRYKKMIAAVQQHLVPFGVTLPQTDREVVGGYFVWLSLPLKVNADELAARSVKEENLIIGQGSLFGVYGDRESVNLDGGVRLCFSWEEESALEEGVQRLARVIQRMLGEAGGRKMENLSSGNPAQDEPLDLSRFR